MPGLEGMSMEAFLRPGSSESSARCLCMAATSPVSPREVRANRRFAPPASLVRGTVACWWRRHHCVVHVLDWAFPWVAPSLNPALPLGRIAAASVVHLAQCSPWIMGPMRCGRNGMSPHPIADHGAIARRRDPRVRSIRCAGKSSCLRMSLIVVGFGANPQLHQRIPSRGKSSGPS